MILTNELTEELKNYFNSKSEFGERLPNIKDVAEGTTYFLKSSDTYIEHIALKGAWYKKIVDSNSQVVIEKVG